MNRSNERLETSSLRSRILRYESRVIIVWKEEESEIRENEIYWFLVIMECFHNKVFNIYRLPFFLSLILFQFLRLAQNFRLSSSFIDKREEEELIDYHGR